MNIDKIEKNKIIKLIKFALEKEHFTVEQASTYCNMGTTDFDRIWKSIFIPTPNQEGIIHPSMEYQWVLKPEAFFSYMSYLEYKDSITSSKKALKLATVSIIISSAVAILTTLVL